MELTVNDVVIGMPLQERFIKWAKIGTGETVDLTLSGGYRLTGKWTVNTDIDVMLDPLDYLVMVYQKKYTNFYCFNCEGDNVLEGGIKKVLKRINNVCGGGLFTASEYNDQGPVGDAALYIAVMNRLRGFPMMLPLLLHDESKDVVRVVTYLLQEV